MSVRDGTGYVWCPEYAQFQGGKKIPTFRQCVDMEERARRAGTLERYDNKNNLISGPGKWYETEGAMRVLGKAEAARRALVAKQ